MNFHIYREITYDNPGKPTYQKLGSTRHLADAEAVLKRWHSGFIINNDGEKIIEKNLTKEKSDDCGLDYSHAWHLYRTPRGKIKTCDGSLTKRKS